MKKTAIGFAVGVLALVPVVALAATSADRTPPSITALNVHSNNINPSAANPGNLVFISFTTSEKVKTPVVLVNSKPVVLFATNTSGNSWTATYTVDSKAPSGKVAYAIGLEDMAQNVYACTSLRVPLIPYCPTTDGSSVTISMTPPPPPDTTAPVIAPHADVSVETTSLSGTTVTYTNPTATDNKDGVVPVSCVPASGSNFALGSTTVNCSASDAAGNVAHSSFVVGVSLPADTTAPVIAAHGTVSATLPHVSSTSMVVTYTNPTATDDRDGSVAVMCTPASGSSFGLGTTPVTCTAHDAAGNNATPVSFTVVVSPFVPQPVIIASQPIETTLCSPNWRDCYTGGDAQTLIPLGSGAQYQNVLLTGATIAKQDDISGTGEFNTVDQAWTLSIVCYLDADYTMPCPTWFTSGQTLTTTDGIHWTAPFNFSFDSTKFYQLAINDNGWSISAYGSDTQPFWKLSGLTQ